MKLIIMRGLPGSGKSTYVKNHFPEAVICSADEYFMEDGEYLWDRNQLGDAHKWCFEVALLNMRNRKPVIVVDNTNVRLKDFANYINSGKIQGYSIKVVRIICNVEECFKRGTHDVPLTSLVTMLLQFEDMPGESLVVAEYLIQSVKYK